MSEIVLKGIDGANPLGFLAAAGTMAIANDIWPNRIRMTWRRLNSYQPILECPDISCDEKCVSDVDLQLIFAKKIASFLDLPAKEKTREEETNLEKAFKDFNKMRKRFDQFEKEIRVKIKGWKTDRIKKGLEGKALNDWIDEKKSMLFKELDALATEMQVKRREWLKKLEDSVPSKELALGKTIAVLPQEYRSLAKKLADSASITSRSSVDLISSFASETILKKNGLIESTPFCFTTGSGHQFFLETVWRLMEQVDFSRIHDCLFKEWLFEDEKFSLRWSPLEDRRHALMWDDPGGNTSKTKTNWAANLLAYQGLRLFPAMNVRRKLSVAGFARENGKQFFIWPIWDGWVSLDTVRSLLGNAGLYPFSQGEGKMNLLRNMGVMEIFRSERVKVGTSTLYKINFSPSNPI